MAGCESDVGFYGLLFLPTWGRMFGGLGMGVEWFANRNLIKVPSVGNLTA